MHRAKSGRKDAHSYLNPRGYLSILPKMSKLNRLLVALKPACFIFLLAPTIFFVPCESDTILQKHSLKKLKTFEVSAALTTNKIIALWEVGNLD